jgi:hypothetical protein
MVMGKCVKGESPVSVDEKSTHIFLHEKRKGKQDGYKI